MAAEEPVAENVGTPADAATPAPADDTDLDRAAEPAQPDDATAAERVPTATIDAGSAEEVPGSAADPVVTDQAVNDAGVMDDPRATDGPTER